MIVVGVLSYVLSVIEYDPRVINGSKYFMSPPDAFGPSVLSQQ